MQAADLQTIPAEVVDARAVRMWARPQILLALVTVLFIPLGFFHVLEGIFWFDDEGTLLIGFRSLREGLRMYDDIYSLYGPAYNALYGLIYVCLHVPLTHTSGRLMAAALSMAYTAGFAWVCYRLTRSAAAMLICFLLVTIRLAQLAQSPGHPEEMCLVLLAILLLLGCSVERHRRMITFVGLGTIVAILALIKINLGIYVGCAAVFLLLRASLPAVWNKIALVIVGVLLVILPAAVEVLLADFVWVKEYILFSTLVIGAALVVFPAVPIPAVLTRHHWFVMTGAAFFASCLVIGAMMLTGSSAFAILDAVLLQNAHFLRNWYLPLELGIVGPSAAAVSGLAALVYRFSRSRPAAQGYVDPATLLLKGLVVSADTVLLMFPVQLFFAMVTPFCWLLLVPAPNKPNSQIFGRGMLALVGAAMSLYPFPVAGHQVNIGGLIPTMMIPILGADLLTGLNGFASVRQISAWNVTISALMTVVAAGAALTAQTVREYWHDQPLGLPGTIGIHADPRQVADLTWVTQQLSRCKSSYSFPGLFSFSLWTGHALPTARNLNDTLGFIRPDQQAEIVRSLSREPDLCVVYHPGALAFFDRGQIATDPPLLHFIQTSFTEVAERDGYVILRPRWSGEAGFQ